MKNRKNQFFLKKTAFGGVYYQRSIRFDIKFFLQVLYFWGEIYTLNKE